MRRTEKQRKKMSGSGKTKQLKVYQRQNCVRCTRTEVPRAHNLLNLFKNRPRKDKSNQRNVNSGQKRLTAISLASTSS